MATSKPITVLEYLRFMSNVLSVRRSQAEPDHYYISVKDNSDSHLICKESILHIVQNTCEMGEPILIFTEKATIQDMQKLLNILSGYMYTLLSKYNRLISLYVKNVKIGDRTYNVLYASMFFEKETYADLLLIFATFRDAISETEKMVIRASYAEYIEKDLLIPNYANPVVSLNYVREVMSSSV